jgi:hypothetical protein
MLEGIEVAPLGPGETTLAREDVLQAFREARRSVRDCARTEGIDRSAWRGMRGTPRDLTYDVGPDGVVVPGSFVSNPPLDPAITRCFTQSIEATRLPAPGGQGARVSMAMPATPRRDGGAGYIQPRAAPLQSAPSR